MDETIRAKFLCVSKTVDMDGKGKSYKFKFYPVTSGSKENETFFKYTPSGSLEIGVTATDVFEVGQEYYLDFNKANKE